MLKGIVKDMGFTVPEKNKRIRQSNLNFKGYDLNVPRQVPSFLLRQRRKDLLASGEVQAGEKIVPIEYEVLRVDRDGNLVGISKYLWIAIAMEG